MSRKDYEKIAKAIKDTFEYPNDTPHAVIRFVEEYKADLCVALSKVFKADNDSFSKDKFLDACDIPEFRY